jgi:hypothetical protein
MRNAYSGRLNNTFNKIGKCLIQFTDFPISDIAPRKLYVKLGSSRHPKLRAKAYSVATSVVKHEIAAVRLIGFLEPA